jgi:hypothetical protein
MAAFALGLIGDASARPALLNALKDSEPIVQGRAAEALGTIGDRSDAPAIAAMVKTWVQGGALNTSRPTTLPGRWRRPSKPFDWVSTHSSGSAPTKASQRAW